MTITCSFVPVRQVKVVSSSSDPKLDTLIASLNEFIEQANHNSLTQTELKELILQQQRLMNIHLSSMTDMENVDLLKGIDLNEDIDNDN